MMKIIVGLIGAKGAGKTTVFEMLQERIPVQEITLATKLKDVCATVTTIPRDFFDSHEYKEKPLQTPLTLTWPMLTSIYEAYGLRADYEAMIRPHMGMTFKTPRRIAQYVGTEVLRSVEADIHCRAATEELTHHVSVVTDIRFPNELRYFADQHDTSFLPIYIHNPKAEEAAQGDGHASEAHLNTLKSQCILRIDNHTTVEDLQRRVEAVSRVLGGMEED